MNLKERLSPEAVRLTRKHDDEGLRLSNSHKEGPSTMNLQTRSGGFVWAVIFYHNPKNNIILLSLNHKSAAESMPVSYTHLQPSVQSLDPGKRPGLPPERHAGGGAGGADGRPMRRHFGKATERH